MEIFASSKGCVFVPSPRGGGGAYALEGLDRGSAESPILIQGADLHDADILLPVSLLDGGKILYTFGRAWGDVSVAGVVLLGSAGDGSLKKVKSWFESRRVGGSTDPRPVNLSTPGGPYKLYIHAFGLGMPDAEFHIQPFMVYGKIASPSK